MHCGKNNLFLAPKLIAVSRLSESHPFLSSKDIVSACESQTTDCKTLQLQGLSVLELQLVSGKNKLSASHFRKISAKFIYLFHLLCI